MASCTNNTAYHHYIPIKTESWCKTDTLYFTLPDSMPSGYYNSRIGIRHTVDYPYRDLWLSVHFPGNEKAVSKVINELSRKGADVIFQDAHVSGHACQEEIKLIYSLVKPKYAIPVHGEYRHLKAQAGIAKELGIPKENIFILSSGDVLE